MCIVILANYDVGLYKFRRELLEKLCKNNNVIIILPNGDFIKDLEGIGCQYIPLEFNRRGKNPLADIRQLKEYIRLLRKIKPEVVLTYTIKPNIYGGLACQIMHIPYIPNITGLGTAVENGGLLQFITINLYKYGLKKAACVFFQNKENQKFFIQKGVLCGKNRLIPGSGVNLFQYRYENYPSESEGIRFLFVGRIMRDKGIGELLSVMANVHDKNKRVTLDVVGGCDEDYVSELEEAERKGIIRYHGFQNDMYPFYKNCHCVVLPSYHEGLANVLLEGSAIGRPVIATRVAGCRETFTDEVTGYGCEMKDVASLQLAVEKFLSLSYEERQQMGKNARRKMEASFDRQKVIDAYIEEIEDVKNRKGI